jgi:hypothetical protein
MTTMAHPSPLTDGSTYFRRLIASNLLDKMSRGLSPTVESR